MSLNSASILQAWSSRRHYTFDDDYLDDLSRALKERENELQARAACDRPNSGESREDERTREDSARATEGSEK